MCVGFGEGFTCIEPFIEPDFMEPCIIEPCMALGFGEGPAAEAMPVDARAIANEARIAYGWFMQRSYRSRPIVSVSAPTFS